MDLRLRLPGVIRVLQHTRGVVRHFEVTLLQKLNFTLEPRK